MAQQYGSICTPSEESESTVYTITTPQLLDEPKFNSFISRGLYSAITLSNVFHLEDPTCLDDVKRQNENFLEKKDAIRTLLMTVRTDLEMKLEALMVCETTLT